MGTHRNGQPGEGSDADEPEDDVIGWTLRDPNRVHVTLDNLADLADLASLRSPEGRVDPAGPPPHPLPPSPNGRVVDEAGTTDNASRLKRQPTAAPRRSRATSGAPAAPSADFFTEQPERTAWVVPAARQQPDPMMVDAPEPGRSSWAGPAERWLLELLAVAVASVAFVTPSIWLVAVTLAVVVGASVAFVSSGNRLAALPGRAVSRTVTLLHPRSSLWLPVLVSRTLIAAMVLPAAVAVLRWIDTQGTVGVVAAARQGVWVDGFRVAAALVCAMLLTSVGDGRHRRAAAVRRWARPATDGTLLLLAVSCCAMAGMAVLAVPHPADPIASRSDGLGLVPPGARAYVDRVRDDIVSNELDALASCLSSRTDTIWQTAYSSENAIGDRDVARFVAAGPAQGQLLDLATVVMAAHNQLAPWVETIEVEWAGGGLIRTDRETLSRRQPLTDATELVAATSKGSQWVARWAAKPAVALRCSAGPVL